jgi:3-oxoacyl-[acyl-carrier protein] reductase
VSAAPIRLNGRVALVTGAAGGIGSAISERFGAEGASVVAGDIDVTGSERTAKRLGERGLAVELDVTDRGDWQRAVDATLKRFGSLDILINNAGMVRDRTLAKMSDEEWGTVLDVNLRGAWLGIQNVLPVMRERGWGRIVNLSSTSANGAFGQGNYAAAKAGIIGLTRTAALEGAGHGVLVNAIAPGGVDTAMTQALPRELTEEYIARNPLRRLAEPREIAAVAAFLASDDASYVTGQTVYVDGGRLGLNYTVPVPED